MSGQGSSSDHGLRPPGVDEEPQGPARPGNQGPPAGQGLAAVPRGQGGFVVGNLEAEQGQGPQGHGQRPQGQGPQGQGPPGQGLQGLGPHGQGPNCRAVRAQQWAVADDDAGAGQQLRAPASAQVLPQAPGEAPRDDIQAFTAALEQRMAEQFANLAEQLTTRFEALATFAVTQNIPLPVPTPTSTQTQPQPTPSTSRTPMRVKEYHGETDYGIYAVQFSSCARHNGWDNLRRKDELINALQGKALMLLQCMPHLRAPDVTFEQVDDALRRTFAHKVTIWERLQQFQKLRQGEKQSLQEFAREVESKATLAYPDMQSSDLTPLKIQAFINGLQNERTKAALAFQTYPDLMAALDSAIQGNTILGEPPAKKVRLTKVSEKEDDKTSTQCLQALVTALHSQPGKSEQSEAAKVQMYFPDKGGAPSNSDAASSSTGGGATGGATGDNRGRGRGRGRPRGSRGGGRGRGGYGNTGNAGGAGGAVFCTFCNKRGHTTDDCWTKAAQQQQQQLQQHQQQQMPQQIPLYPPQYYHAGMSWQNQPSPMPHQYYGYLPPSQPMGASQQVQQAPAQPQPPQGNNPQGNNAQGNLQ